jgi:uncharacterized phiE125 gp8 family phage protein
MRPPVVIEAADALPVSLEAARAACRIDHTDDDAELAAKIRTAFSFLQPPIGWLGRSVLRQTLELRLPAFPRTTITVRLPCGPVSEVVQVTYFDGNNAEQTVPNTSYFLEQDELVWDERFNIPTTYVRPGAVRIRYRAGYATPADIPPAISEAILQMVAHWYENREAVATVGVGSMMPLQAIDLLHPYRIW